MSETEYKIGAVSKMTGIGIETLRMWERRYGAVQPSRGNGTSRLYSEKDIARLTLLKQLVDKGNSISSVANLDEYELELRMQKIEQFANKQSSATHAGQEPVKAIVCGRSLPINLKLNKDQTPGLRVSLELDNLDQLLSSTIDDDYDLLIVELAVVHAEDVATIRRAAEHCRCHRILLIYAYCNKKVLKSLNIEQINSLPAPVIPSLIDRRCNELLQNERGGNGGSGLKLDDDIKDRLYDDATLAHIMNCATSINCECPQHLSDIIYKLAAFEQYSSSCENRSDSDKQLHSMLYHVANQTRALFEQSLTHVIEYEGIDINRVKNNGRS